MPIEPTAGIGFKPQHADEAMHCAVAGLWFEVHPENYLMDGGPCLALLDALAARFPVALHGVSLSLGGAMPPDAAHLARLERLIGRIQPVRFSEHLAWSSWAGRYFPDLLPLPRTHEVLQRMVDHVTCVQEALGRRISIENPAHYLPLDGHDWSEPDFLAELARRSGCGLLLDVNNVYVSAHNLGEDAQACVDAFPLHAVTEIHLAGHGEDGMADGALLIDSHDAPVSEAVWALFRRVVARGGPRPTLIERDGNLPSFNELLAERDRAQRLLDANGEVT